MKNNHQNKIDPNKINILDTEASFYRPLVVFAQQNRGIDTLEEALKEKILKSLQEILRKTNPKANTAILDAKNLEAISALIPKGPLSDELSEFANAFVQFKGAIDGCASDIMNTTNDPKHKPSTFSKVVHAARNLLGAITALLVPITAVAHVPAVSAMVGDTMVGAIIAPVYTQALIAVFVTGTASVAATLLDAYLTKRNVDAVETVLTDAKKSIDWMEESLVSIIAKLDKAQDKGPAVGQ